MKKNIKRLNEKILLDEQREQTKEIPEITEIQEYLLDHKIRGYNTCYYRRFALVIKLEKLEKELLKLRR
jgi:maltooligosyltrehalose synthase